MLIEALQQFKGTFIVVSHDRHFLDQIVNKVWRVGQGKIREYIGNYADYLWQTEHGTASRISRPEIDTEKNSKNAEAKKRSGGPKTKEQKRREAEERNQRYQEALKNNGLSADITSPAQLKKAYQNLEKQIATKEEELSSVESSLADPEVYAQADKAKRLTNTYHSLKNELSAMYESWEQLAGALEEIG